MSKFRIGFIGCGNISAGHARRIAELPDAEVVALCDINPEAFTRLAKRAPSVAGVPTFSNYLDMLNNTQLDAVEVLTPHTLHYEHVITSLDYGLHVLVEKPMACSTNHAKDIMRRSKECGKVVLVSYQRHYQNTYLFLRDIIHQGIIGPIQFISALQAQNWLENTRGTWRQNPALSGGGQLNDSGSHLLDVLLWLTGLVPETVFATSENFTSQVDINTSLTVRCTNGAIMSLGVVGNGTDFYEDVTIWGANGVAYYRNGTVSVKVRGEENIRQPLSSPDASNPDQNFIDAILGRDTIKSCAADALKVIGLTEAAWHSVESGCVEAVNAATESAA